MYQHLPSYVGDPILSLMETFAQDPRPNKISLAIGIYFDNNGKMPLPNSILNAQNALPTGVQSYLPMEGHAGFRAEVGKLLLGADSPALTDNRVAVVQTLGGSGALKLGADLLHRFFPQSQAFVSDPTWDNHRSILEGAGFTVGNYPYYDPETIGVKFDEMCEFIFRLPEQSVILLHPCCHNPTGVDLTEKQWDKLLDIIAQRQHIPFMDIAYQGFGDSFDNDAYAIRKAVALNLPVLVSCSFSKNMAQYGHRIGALLVLAPNAAEAELVLGQLKFGVRRIYSSPPAQGALTAFNVLSNDNTLNQWKNEVYEMRDRIRQMRQKLYDTLTFRLPERDFSYFIQQRGMFSYTGLTVEQVHRLRDEFAIYLLDSGRLCVAGLNDGNIDAVTEAFVQVFNH